MILGEPLPCIPGTSGIYADQILIQAEQIQQQPRSTDGGSRLLQISQLISGGGHPHGPSNRLFRGALFGGGRGGAGAGGALGSGTTTTGMVGGALAKSPGVEPYYLMEYLTLHYGDCRPVIEVTTSSTAMPTSTALALASGCSGRQHHLHQHHAQAETQQDKSSCHVQSFHARKDAPAIGAEGVGAPLDMQPHHRHILQQLRNRKNNGGNTREEEEAANELLKMAGLTVETRKDIDLIEMPYEDFVRQFNATWLIVLDTQEHLPYTYKWEQKFIARLRNMSYAGLLLLDEIHGAGVIGGEMERWW